MMVKARYWDSELLGSIPSSKRKCDLVVSAEGWFLELLGSVCSSLRKCGLLIITGAGVSNQKWIRNPSCN